MFYLISGIIVAIITIVLYIVGYKNNIYGGKFHEHFKNRDEK